MFAENLSNMAKHPYSREINQIVHVAIRIFQEECSNIANHGGHSISTTVKYYDGDYDASTFYFGKYRSCRYENMGFPENMRESIFLEIQELLRAELAKAGFKNSKVEGITEGPFYFPVYFLGIRTFLKNKSDPKYDKFIKITASW